MQRFLFRAIMLRNFLLNICAATRAGIWKVLVQLNSALFLRNLHTMSPSVFRIQNRIKSLIIRLIYRRAVSFLSIVVLMAREVKNWFWIPVVCQIFSVMKVFLLESMMFLWKHVWMLITVFHLWKSIVSTNSPYLTNEVYLCIEFKWLFLCSWSFVDFIKCDCTWS